MATTTDTLIFELKVKDEASKTFDAWEKKLRELEKVAASIDISGALSDAFKDIDTSKIADMPQKLKSSFVPGMKDVFAGVVGIATSAFTKIVEVGFDAFKKIGKTVFDFVKDSTKTFINFEDQLAQTGKTMGIAGEELKDFGKEIIELAKPIGSLTAENLLQVAEVAGQLGIAKEDVGAFAVEVGKGAIALTKFGGDTEKLATSIAKQQNIFNLAADSAGNLLSTMDALSKNTAANELQISNFNLGMAKVASTMGITAAESSALGSVLISGGLDASKASRLLSSSLVDLSTKSKSLGASVQIMQQDMARGGEGISKLEEITGRSRESFSSLSEMIKTAFGVDAVQSMLAVSGAFDKIPPSAQKTELAYDAVGKTGLAVMSLLGAAVNKGAEDTKSMAFALQTAEQAFQSGQSHLDSYAIATEKTSEKVKEFFSVLDAIKLVIGEEVANALARVVEKGTELLNEISNWITESEAFKIVWGDIVRGFESLANVGITFLTEQFREFIQYIEADGLNVWNQFVDVVLDLREKFLAWIHDVSTQMSQVDPSAIAEGFKSIIPAIQAVGEAAKVLVGAIQAIKDATGGLNIGEHFQHLKDILGGVSDILRGDIAEGLSRIAIALKDEIILNVKTFGETFKNVFDGILKLGISVMEKIGTAITDKIGGAIQKAKDLFKSFGKGADTSMKKTADAAEDAAKAIDGVNTSTKAADESQQTYGEHAYGNSVWPDTKEWVEKTSKAIGGLSSATKAADSAMLGMENKAKAAAKAFEVPFNAVGGFRMTDSEFREIAAQRPAAQPAEPGTTTTRTVQSVSGTTQTTVQPTTITNVSTVAIDESSLQRLVRQITSTQTSLTSQMVSA